jgi:hypothetical protein
MEAEDLLQIQEDQALVVVQEVQAQEAAVAQVVVLIQEIQETKLQEEVLHP